MTNLDILTITNNNYYMGFQHQILAIAMEDGGSFSQVGAVLKLPTDGKDLLVVGEPRILRSCHRSTIQMALVVVVFITGW